MCFNLFDFLLRRSMIWALGSFNSVPFEELASPRTLFWRGWGPEPSCSCRLHVPLLGRRDEKMCFSSLSFHSWSQRHKRSLQFSEHPSLSRSRLFMAIFSVNEKRESTSVQPVRASSLDYPHKTFSIRGGTGRRGGGSTDWPFWKCLSLGLGGGSGEGIPWSGWGMVAARYALAFIFSSQKLTFYLCSL